jgi:penicillin amidase
MKRTLIAAAGLIVALVIGATVSLRASLPVLDGERRLAGLAAAVVVTRDGLGVPTVRGRTRVDAARATGFLHAQERFFQMDLLRRLAAGELAALFGAAAVDSDRRNRVHGLRQVSKAAVVAMTASEREVLAAYVAGVNAGIAQLTVRPPEYLLLRSSPEPWRPEDTVLVVHAMFLRLSDGNAMAEMRKGLLFECLPEPVAAFLASSDPDWAATVDGGVLSAAPTPVAADFDLRTLKGMDFDTGRSVAQTLAIDPSLPGGASNAWVVAGSRTTHGHALVANDMHLSLGLPNVWYRQRLVVDGGSGPALDVNGVTLPGAPAMVAGSNGRVAWGFTNAYGDWSDRIRLRIDPDDPDAYLTPDGSKKFRVRAERIRVRGGDDVLYTVRETVWGPVVADPLERPTALRWIGHRAEATNLRLLALEEAASVDEALAVAPHLGIPPQNLNVGDDQGHIGWTIAGRIPVRGGYDPTRPTDGATSAQGWNGWLAPEDYPRIVDPPGGLIWTANHPVVTGADLALIGDSGYWHGSRARQIRDALRALERASEADMQRIQLDDRALLLARWKALLLSLLDGPDAVAHPRAAGFREALVRGDGRASAQSVDYRLVSTFRARLRDVVFSAITAPCRKRMADYRFEGFRQYEGPLWRLVTERPAHLLHPAFADWNALLVSVAQETVEYLSTHFEGPFAERTWGEHNVLTMRHPLTRAVPALSPWLNLAPTRMSGDRNMPRVMAFDDGASERFGVAPGRERDAYLHMPGGQSGHFLSPYYGAGHDSWVKGEWSPFLPGKAVHELRLIPDW